MHAVESVLRKTPGSIQRLVIADSRHDRRIEKLLDLANNQGVVVERLAKDQLRQLCGHTRHQGAVAQVRGSIVRDGTQLLTDLAALAGEPPLVLLLDGVTDPHNLGACLRSAEAAGVHAVVVPRDKAVGMTPVVRRVSAGAADSVRFYQVTNLARTIEALQSAGIWVYGAAGEATEVLYDINLKGASCIVMGAEGSGLRTRTRQACDALFRIPIAGQVESLNVSVATGICLFEARRQRR